MIESVSAVVHRSANSVVESEDACEGGAHQHSAGDAHTAVALHASAHHEAVPRLEDVECQALPRQHRRHHKYRQVPPRAAVRRTRPHLQRACQV